MLVKFPDCDCPLHYLRMGEEKLSFTDGPLYESHTSKHLSEALTEAVTVRVKDTFAKDNFLCQINEKHVGTSNVSSLAKILPTFNLRLSQ